MTHLLHRGLRDVPPRAVSAAGLIVRTEDGREIIDASGGAAVSCLGHGHPRVIAAIQQQAGELAFAYSGFFTTAPAEELAERLVGHAPGGLTHAYIVSGGSEAGEAALKLARQYFVEVGQPQRHRFIARRQSYHGNTLGALAAGGNMARPRHLRAAASAMPSAMSRRPSPTVIKEMTRRRRLSSPVWPASWRPSSSGLGPGHGRGLHRRARWSARRLGPRRAPAGYFQAVRGPSATGTARC